MNIQNTWINHLDPTKETKLNDSARFFQAIPVALWTICAVSTILSLGVSFLAPPRYLISSYRALTGNAVLAYIIAPLSTTSFEDLAKKSLLKAKKIKRIREIQNSIQMAPDLKNQLASQISKIFTNNPPDAIKNLDNIPNITSLTLPILSLLYYLEEEINQKTEELQLLNQSPNEEYLHFIDSIKDSSNEEIISAAEKESNVYIELYNPNTPEIHRLKTLLNKIREDSPCRDKIKEKIKTLTKKQKLSALEANKKKFELEKEFFLYKTAQINLLTFLLREPCDFLDAIDNFGVNVDVSLFPKLQKEKKLPSETNLRIGQAVQSSNWDILFHLPKEGRITRSEVTGNPKKLFERLLHVLEEDKEKSLSKLWNTTLNGQFKTANTSSTLWKTAEKIKYLVPLGAIIAITLAPLSLATWSIAAIACLSYPLYSKYISEKQKKATTHLATIQKIQKEYNTTNPENPQKEKERIIMSIEATATEKEKVNSFLTRPTRDLIRAIKNYGTSIEKDFAMSE